jgi:hypothetical protein
MQNVPDFGIPEFPEIGKSVPENTQNRLIFTYFISRYSRETTKLEKPLFGNLGKFRRVRKPSGHFPEFPEIRECLKTPKIV